MKYSIIKKAIAGFAIIAQLMSTGAFCIPAYASENSINFEKAKQEQIDALFTELNNLALEKKMQNELHTETYSTASLSKISSMETQIEKELEDLGVNKIDPSNEEDISRLATIVNSTSHSMRSTFDFSMLANVYSIYDYDGTYTINGTSYEYQYYRVIDNKGYVDTTLTTAELIVPVAKVHTTIGALLDYNFSYGFSSFLGLLPYGNIADWFLGNIFTALDSYSANSPVVYNNNTGIYSINMISVTAMTYYYIKVNGLWYQCGSRAGDVSFGRVDSISANINGQPYTDAKTYPNWRSSTGHSWYWYLENFVATAWPRHDELGSIDVYRDSTKVHTFTPAFISNPWGLI